MVKSFEIIEVESELFIIGDRFKLSDSTPSNFNIIRMICGNTLITNLDTENSINQTNNYIASSYVYNNDKSFENNLTEILNESINEDDLYKFFFDIKYKNKNKEFFNRLENEFCNYLTYSEKQNHTTAFVFIYRILELISYSFPLIYASKTYDFKHTYANLKEMFDNNAGNSKGELGFLKSAINVIFSESPFIDTSIDIKLEDEHFKNKKIFKAVKSIINNNILHEDTIDDNIISIKFNETSGFIATLRNRFFHLFNRGDKNLESHEVVDPDYFFSKMNDPLFSWICIVYIEIIKFLLEEQAKYTPSE